VFIFILIFFPLLPRCPTNSRILTLTERDNVVVSVTLFQSLSQLFDFRIAAVADFTGLPSPPPPPPLNVFISVISLLLLWAEVVVEEVVLVMVVEVVMEAVVVMVVMEVVEVAAGEL